MLEVEHGFREDSYALLNKVPNIRLLPKSRPLVAKPSCPYFLTMSTSTVPAYFEESWAILSSVGLVNVLFGLMIIGITSLSPVSLVPIIVSVAGAIANGLCYYAFYADYPKTGTVIAGAVADVAWLVSSTLPVRKMIHSLSGDLDPRSRAVLL
jgi:hypothetical protein